jgi:two-component system nitrogen regulation response regulator GlnG
MLVDYFINKYRQRQPTGPSQIARDAMEAIQRYPWPGNVRELENCVQRAMVLAAGNTITLSNLPEEITRGTRSGTSLAALPAVESANGSIAPAAQSKTSSAGDPDKEALARAVETLFDFARRDKQFKLLPAAERELIVRALAETSGNQVQAAKLLGITRATLRKRVDKFGIQKRMAID